MERAERLGLGAAAAGHVALFALLSLAWAAAPPPEVVRQRPIDVSLVQEVALTQTSPAPTPPAPSVAPDKGAPEEEAAPPEPAPVVAKPAPPKPAPEKVEPAPKPVRAKVEPPAPAPKPVKPKPAVKPAPPKATPQPKPAAAAVSPAKPKAKAKPTRSSLDNLLDDLPATDAAAKSATQGKSATATATKARGARLGPDILKGLTDAPSKAPRAAAAPGVVSAQAKVDIASAILRQVQPCANRQVNPGPGAERIRVAIALDLNRDGSLASAPRVVNHDGVDEENRRYLDRVDDLATATFTGCSPLKGLPDNLFDVPGGWRHFTLRYKLPG